MPGEMTHWLVLEEAILEIEKQSPELAKIVTDNKPAARLGCMLHDAPYYYRLGGKPPELMAAFLHGSFKNNTFEPLLRLANYIQEQSQENTEILWAVLFGMASHFATDIEFHPFVYSKTGDYYHPDLDGRKTARRRHRLLEVYLDSWFASRLRDRFGKRAARTLIKDWLELSENRKQIEEMLDRSLALSIFPELAEEIEPGWEENKFWKESIHYLVFCQAAFESMAGGMLLRGLSKIAPVKVGAIDALASWKRGKTELLDGVHSFCNPVIGSEQSESLIGLKAKAVERTVDTILKFRPAVEDSKFDCSKLLDEVEGLSLNFAVNDSDKKSAKHFSGFDLIESLEKLG